jgi:glycosyltransferase involved in cell wall biosynthesis
MAHLCIDVRMAFGSGIGTYIRQIVPLLRDFQITLLVDRLGQEWCREFDQILFTAPIYSLTEQFQFRSKIPRCDLFWSPHYNVPLGPIRAKKRVVTIHDTCHLALGTVLQKGYARVVMKAALRKSDRVITVSRFSAGEIFRYMGWQNIEIVPNAINCKQFQRVDRAEGFRKKYGLPERFVLFVGNNKVHKNLERLQRAVLKARVPGLELVLVGKETSIGVVPDEDLPFLYSMAEMLAFPSLYEGFGLPPLEAMSCGCPTVVSKATSMPEVCGDASVYFDPRNEDEMAEAIAKVAQDKELKTQLIERGFKRVQEFSWERTARRHQQIFEELIYA